MDLYQLSVVVSYCLLSEGLFKGINIHIVSLAESSFCVSLLDPPDNKNTRVGFLRTQIS